MVEVGHQKLTTTTTAHPPSFPMILFIDAVQVLTCSHVSPESAKYHCPLFPRREHAKACTVTSVVLLCILSNLMYDGKAYHTAV